MDGNWRTHIPGFDQLIPSGIPLGSTLLLLGAPGSGKTNFCRHILHESLSRGDHGLIVTTEDPPEIIKERVMSFGWDFGSYEKRALLNFIDCYSFRYQPSTTPGPGVYVVEDPHDLTSIGILIDTLLKKTPKELVIVFDSISTLMLYADSQTIIRFAQLQLARLRALKSIGLIVMEEGLHSQQVINTMRFLCDGVVEMRLLEAESGEIVHQLRVHSLRGARVITRWVPFSLETRGIVVEHLRNHE